MTPKADAALPLGAGAPKDLFAGLVDAASPGHHYAVRC